MSDSEESENSVDLQAGLKEYEQSFPMLNAKQRVLHSLSLNEGQNVENPELDGLETVLLHKNRQKLIKNILSSSVLTTPATTNNPILFNKIEELKSKLIILAQQNKTLSKQHDTLVECRKQLENAKVQKSRADKKLKEQLGEHSHEISTLEKNQELIRTQDYETKNQIENRLSRINFLRNLVVVSISRSDVDLKKHPNLKNLLIEYSNSITFTDLRND